MDAQHLSDLLALVAEISRRIAKRIESVEEEFEEVMDLVAKGVFELRHGAKASPTRRRHRRTGASVQQYAKPVETIFLARDEDRALVSIDGNEPLRVAPRLLELLRFACSGPPGSDGVVGPQALEGACQALGLNAHGVANLVCRLRRVLEDNGYNPFLLERTATGLRFRTRRLVVAPGVRAAG